MRRLNLKSYDVKNGEKVEPYLIVPSIEAMLFSPNLRLTAISLRSSEKIMSKIESRQEIGEVLLEESEYDWLKQCLTSFQGFTRYDLEFVDRIENAPQIEVKEA